MTRCSSGAILFVRLFISMEVNASVHTDEVPAVAKYPNNIKPKLVCSEYNKNCKIIHLSLGSFTYNIRKKRNICNSPIEIYHNLSTISVFKLVFPDLCIHTNLNENIIRFHYFHN